MRTIAVWIFAFGICLFPMMVNAAEVSTNESRRKHFPSGKRSLFSVIEGARQNTFLSVPPDTC